MKKLGWIVILLVTHVCLGEDQPFIIGGDVSALSDMEKAGAVYRDHDQSGDAIEILHRHGCNLFRLRLFVNPNQTKSMGATQDLPMVMALAKRVKKSGAQLSLALHYSDTWADPKNQSMPAKWVGLSFDDLQKQVTDYTTGVLVAMKSNGTPPDIVEVGNETTNGMLWPAGKLGGATADEKRLHWDQYAKLLTAGTRAVRSVLPGARILVHIDQGGRPPTAGWFFGELKKHGCDYDIIGLSFYPMWKDDIGGLKRNLSALSVYGKDVLIIETAYAYRGRQTSPQETWPLTPAGQDQFLKDEIAAMKSAADGRGIGVVWWYPEAIPLPNHRVWENGSLGLFDETGNLLPALDAQKAK